MPVTDIYASYTKKPDTASHAGTGITAKIKNVMVGRAQARTVMTELMEPERVATVHYRDRTVPSTSDLPLAPWEFTWVLPFIV